MSSQEPKGGVWEGPMRKGGTGVSTAVQASLKGAHRGPPDQGRTPSCPLPPAWALPCQTSRTGQAHRLGTRGEVTRSVARTHVVPETVGTHAHMVCTRYAF